MRIGIFGGTFDPPHMGHLILAAECQDQLALERVLWVLTPVPPHKPGKPVTDTATRLAMLQAALPDDAGFEISRVEIDRKPPHYAVDTMRLLRQAHPADTLVYLMGGDSLRDLPRWYQPQAFVNACDEIGVMRRPGDAFDLNELERALPGLSARVRFVDAPLLDISSSQIRARIAGGRSVRFYLPSSVYEMVISYGLYRNPA